MNIVFGIVLIAFGMLLIGECVYSHINYEPVEGHGLKSVVIIGSAFIAAGIVFIIVTQILLSKYYM